MTDIAMCKATNCPASHDCRRHPDSGMIPDPLRQCYADWQPDDTGACDGYWHVIRPDNNCAKCGKPVRDTDTITYNKKTGVLAHADCHKAIP